MGHDRAGDSDNRYCTLRALGLDRDIFHPRTFYVYDLIERCNGLYRLHTSEPGISTSVYAAGEARCTPLYTNTTCSSQRHLGPSTSSLCGYVQSSGGHRERQALIKQTFKELISWPPTHYCIFYLVLAFIKPRRKTLCLSSRDMRRVPCLVVGSVDSLTLSSS